MSVNAIATYFFKPTTTGEQGWTESWYVPQNDLASALSVASAYIQQRTKVLMTAWYIEQVRVSDISILGDSLLASYYPANSKGTLSLGTPAPANTCLLVRIECGALRRRVLELRGIPQAILDEDNVYTPVATFTTAFNAWATFLKSLSSGLRVRSRTRGNRSPASITPLATDPRALSITPDTIPPGMVAGNTIQVAGVPQNVAYGYNGNWIVDKVGPVTINTRPKRKKYLLGLATGAVIYSLTDDYLRPSDVIPERGSTRKTGRPFDVPHGRLLATRH